MKKILKKRFNLVFCTIVLSIVLIFIFKDNLTKKSFAREVDEIYTGMDKYIENEVKINSSLAMSSNPYDYIKNNPYYDKIVSMGVKVLPELERHLQIEGEGLDGYISALAIEEIFDRSVSSIKNNAWENGKEFESLWLVVKNDIEDDITGIITCGNTTDEIINQLNKYGTLAAPFLDNIINNSSKSNNNATAGVEINETEIKELSEYRESLKINKNEVELLSDFLKLD